MAEISPVVWPAVNFVWGKYKGTLAAIWCTVLEYSYYTIGVG